MDSKVFLSVASSSAEPAHVHVGKCPTPGAVKYPLKDVVNGMSETTLPVSLEVMACGDVGFSQGSLMRFDHTKKESN